MHKNFNFLKLTGKKAIAALVLTLIVFSVAVGGTLAYITERTKTLVNTFTPTEIKISSWTYDDLINSGDTPVYVRATFVAAWVSDDEAKTVWSEDPQMGIDYTLTVSNNWFLASDGFYYRKATLNAAQSVDFVHATQLTEKEGYTLRIMVAYAAMQPTKEAVEYAWPAVTVADDGTLMPKEEVTP